MSRLRKWVKPGGRVSVVYGYPDVTTMNFTSVPILRARRKVMGGAYLATPVRR